MNEELENDELYNQTYQYYSRWSYKDIINFEKSSAFQALPVNQKKAIQQACYDNTPMDKTFYNIGMKLDYNELCYMMGNPDNQLTPEQLKAVNEAINVRKPLEEEKLRENEMEKGKQKTLTLSNNRKNGYMNILYLALIISSLSVGVLAFIVLK